jgi:EpsI family protein
MASRGRAAAIGAAMVAAAGLSVVLTPTERDADRIGVLELELLVPVAFGDWRIDPLVLPLQVSPDVQEQLDKIYDRTLARTYVNGEGKRVMLSIAYGAVQTRALQLHKPEICYAAQGFEVKASVPAAFAGPAGPMPVRRVIAAQGPRNEPITYWMRMGDDIVYGGVEQTLTRVRYGLRGRVPDGLLFRVSTIGMDEAREFALQDLFLSQLLSSLSPPARSRLIGEPAA